MNVTFDIETTGLVPKGLNWKTGYMEFPYIVQIAWKRSDKSFVNDFIIKPNGYIIPHDSTKIHGITNEVALKKGILLEKVIKEFVKDCLIANNIIGHNIYFDTSIIKANVLRLNSDCIDGLILVLDKSNGLILALDKSKRIDTMMKTIKFCGLKQKNGKSPKFPSLEELYFKLFNTTFDAHNAADDVIATEKCYNRLIELKII